MTSSISNQVGANLPPILINTIIADTVPGVTETVNDHLLANLQASLMKT